MGLLGVYEQRLVRPQHQVAVDDDSHRQARPLGQGRLDVEVAPGHLLAGLVHAVLQAVASGDDEAITVAVRGFPPVLTAFYRQGLGDLLMPGKPYKTNFPEETLPSKTGLVCIVNGTV